MARRGKRPAGTVPARLADPPSATIPEQAVEFLEHAPDLPQDTKVAVLQASAFVGPLHPPVLFREYDEVVPGAAERLLRMAEKEQDHRIDWESRSLRASRLEMMLGQGFGFTVALLMVLGAGVAAYFGHEITAGLFLAAPAMGTVGYFIKGRSSGNDTANLKK